MQPSPYQLAMAKLDRQIAALQKKRAELATTDLPALAELRKLALLPSEKPSRKVATSSRSSAALSRY
jgi:hypothetical protein